MTKIIYNRFIPFGKYAAINLFGLIVVKKGLVLSKRDINHELIHTAQQREMLWIFFYLWYGIEWLMKIFIYRHSTKAYFNLSFEREAYENENDLKYLTTRRLFSWWKYLKVKKTNVRRKKE